MLTNRCIGKQSGECRHRCSDFWQFLYPRIFGISTKSHIEYELSWYVKTFGGSKVEIFTHTWRCWMLCKHAYLRGN